MNGGWRNITEVGVVVISPEAGRMTVMVGGWGVTAHRQDGNTSS